MRTNELIQQAFNHVKEFYHDIKIMIINSNGMWCFMDENFNAPTFDDTIDIDILQTAVDSAHDMFGLPYIYEHNNNTVRCNNCMWEGEEDDLSLIEFDSEDENETPTSVEDSHGFITTISEEPKERDFLKGCPNCLTDGYLTDV